MKTKIFFILALLCGAAALPVRAAVSDLVVNVTAGKEVDLEVTADGTPPFAYQWKFNGTPIPAQNGGTGSLLVLLNITTEYSGAFTVDVSNSAGTTTSPKATLAVVPPVVAPVITTQPKSQQIMAGSPVSFSVAATGTGITYQWKKDGVSIASATLATFTIANPDLNAAGNYTVVVTNAGGSVTSQAAALIVIKVAVPKITGFSATVK